MKAAKHALDPKLKICRDCGTKFIGTINRKELDEAFYQHLKLISQSGDARNHNLTQYRSPKYDPPKPPPQFETDDELYHRLVEVEHEMTSSEFGEALADVRVTPTYPSKHNAPFST